MSPKSSFRNIVHFLFLICFSCVAKTTQTHPKFVSFSASPSEVEARILSIVKCENINVDGRETISSKDTVATVEIRIVNGQNVPTETAQLKPLAKSIALTIMNSLANSHDFQIYQVFFDKVQKSGAGTNTSYTGVTFKIEELNN